VRQGHGECVLHRFLGAIERAAQADQRSDDPPVLTSERRFGDCARLVRA
jgi:hypothetical protein